MNRLLAYLVAGLALAAAPPPLPGSTLVVCDSEHGPTTLDPHRQFAEKNHTICQQIYEGLVRFGPDGQIRPALAVSWERRGEHRMRFELREDVRFHNGEPFNARSVKFSIERYFDPRIEFPAINFLGSIARVEVIDSHTVDIVTEYPDGLLLNRLAGFVLIVPPNYLEENGRDALHEAPVGTGPFRFEAWEREEKIELAANEGYWMEDHPEVDHLVFRFVSSDKQVPLLLNGKVDLVTELPGTMTTRVQASSSARVVKKATFWTVGATFNTQSGPLQDVRVRRALNYAIDRDDLVRYDSRGNGRALASLTMPSQRGHNPNLEPYPHDRAKARELLEASGHDLPIRLKTQVRAEDERTARIIVAQLENVGIELEIQTVPNDAQALKTLREQQPDLGIGGGPDPMCHAFFRQSILLFSKSPFSLVNNETFDRRLMQMVQTLDPEKRESRARSLDRYVHEQALSLFTYQKIRTYGLRAGVRFKPYVSGMPYFYDTAIQESSEPSQTSRRVP